MGDLGRLKSLASVASPVLPLRFLQHKAAVQGELIILQWLSTSSKQFEKDEMTSNNDSLLHTAAENGHESIVAWLLEEEQQGKEFLNKLGEQSQQTPSFLAAMGGHLPVLKLLHSAKADLTILSKSSHLINSLTQEPQWWSPLHAAVEHNHTEMVSWLKDQTSLGGQVYAYDPEATGTPLVLALDHGPPFTMFKLLYPSSLHSSPPSSVHQEVALKGDLELVQWVLTNAKNPIKILHQTYGVLGQFAHNLARNPRGFESLSWLKTAYQDNMDLEAPDLLMRVPLHVALKAGHFTFARSLVEDFHVALTPRDTNGLTFLHQLALSETLPQSEWEWGCAALSQHLDAFDRSGRRPAHCLALMGHVEVLRQHLRAHPTHVEITDYRMQTPLFFAVQGGHVETVRLLIEEFDASLTKMSAVGRDPIMEAIASTQVEVFLYLFSLYPSETRPDLLDKFLTLAAGENSEAILQALLDAGANPNMSTPGGFRMLHYAVLRKHPENVRVLMSKGANPCLCDSHNQPSIFYAVVVGNADMVRYMLVHPGAADVLHKNMSMIHMAVLSGKLDVVKLLVEVGKTKHLETPSARCLCTPLHHAAEKGLLPVVKYLVEEAKVTDSLSATNAKGVTPLQQAQRRGHDEVVTYLSKIMGLDPYKQLLGMFLYRAVAKGKTQTVKTILETKAVDVNHRLTVTPLYMACQIGSEEIAKMLLDAGADVSMPKRNDGETPLYVASEFGHTAIVRLLLDHGAHCDLDKATTDEGLTPLFIALINGHSSVMRMLLGAGASSSIVDKKGRSLLDVAKDKPYLSGIIDGANRPPAPPTPPSEPPSDPSSS